MAQELNIRPFDPSADAFADRVSALRVARDSAPHDALATLDAALAELGHATEALRQRGHFPESDVLTAARQLDVMGRVTRLLLDEESLSEPVALQRAGQVLATELADWAIIDVQCPDGVKRAVVAARNAVDGVGGKLLEQVGAAQSALLTKVLDTGEPVVHTPVGDDTALGTTPGGMPLLTALRAGCVLSVPMRDRQEMLGAVTLIRRNDRGALTWSDVGFVEEIADHLALALRTERRYQRRADVADALQASFLPRALPDVASLEIGAGYHPATAGLEVGGDFYDIFECQGGWGLVLGDVCGKGEEAAAVTAMVRHGVRLLGVWQSEPDALLQQVNHGMVTRQETDRFVTAIASFLTVHEWGVRVRLASAGHPRAAVLRAQGGVEFSSGGGLPLGVCAWAPVAVEDIDLGAGDALLLYSDGVTEARAPSGALYGEEQLAEVLAHHCGASAQALVRAIEKDLYEHSEGRTHDDVALLAVRAEGPRV